MDTRFHGRAVEHLIRCREMDCLTCAAIVLGNFSTNFPQSSSLVPQGTESADIGKLDTADKTGCTSIRGGVKCTRDAGHAGDHRAGDSFRWKAAGSAETGGEKAAPERDAWWWLENYWGKQIREMEPQVIPIHVLVDYLVTYHRHRMATFRRSSQNQTVSGGVEGAHEGTTADNSAASPELLPTQTG